MRRAPRSPSPGACRFGQVFGALALWTCLFGPVLAAPPDDDAARRREAGAAVEAAARDYAAGRFARALAGFERAMALRPSPKLHYNVGACHQQLMLAARSGGDADAEVRHAAEAVAAYNAYLAASPAAEDRAQVEDLVRELGGTPTTRPQLKPIPAARARETGPPPGPPSDVPAPRPPPPPPSAAPSSPPPTPDGQVPVPARPRRGYVGASLGLLAQPQVPTARLEGAAQVLASLRVGGLLGARRRLHLGANVVLSTAGETARDKLGLAAQMLFAELEYNVPLGHSGRFELPIGVFVGAAREALRTRQGQTRPACATSNAGTLVSQRAGGGAGGRVGFLVLLGPRRNHEIGVRLSTAALGFGPGTADAGCDERPFAAYDVPRARWIVTADAGYAFRF